MSEIRTTRVVLRQWRITDLEPWAALNADPLVMAHFPAVLSRAESDTYVRRERAAIEEQGYGLWAVEVDGVLAGSTGLRWTRADRRS